MGEPGVDGQTESVVLVRRAQGGDPVALDRLFTRYYPRVARIVELRMGVDLRNRVGVADILQETFSKAVELFDRFEVREDSGLILWLSRIAENQIRGRSAAPRSEQDPHRLEAVHDAGPPPDEEVIRREDRDAVAEGIGALREHYREVILRRIYAEASWESIAKDLELPSADAARRLYARAVTRLGTRLRSAGD